MYDNSLRNVTKQRYIFNTNDPQHNVMVFLTSTSSNALVTTFEFSGTFPSLCISRGDNKRHVYTACLLDLTIIVL